MMRALRSFMALGQVVAAGAGLVSVDTVFAEEPTPAVAPQAASAATPAPVFTKEMADAIANQKVALDTVWVMITAFLVFFMNLGFALVESGFCRAKNCVNILFKNFAVFAVSTLAFLFLGFGLMFGDGNPIFGQNGLFFAGGSAGSSS